MRALLGFAGGWEGFSLEMRFARDGDRWRVSHRSLEYGSCTEQYQLW